MLWAIRSNSAWANSNSTHTKGYPAIHAFDTELNMVLCGQEIEYFDHITDSRRHKNNEIDFVNCKKCLRRINNDQKKN